ncbi:hypothetical protein BRADI_5g20113v3 [Brachypodium distachyon]|uniref:Inhibitor I9 domain-containing protein n=2 Tax=Brachypodium distachyon TaxID=15368 RepID=A0A0Q3KVY7_BRADI|nr:hypothetical protein BRADI_5g20113v3 [Brachypodium distachyon]
MLVILTTLALAALAVTDLPPKRPGQEVHLFEVTVSVPEDGKVDDEYNYRILATVLGSVEAAESVISENDVGSFKAYLTNNQARRLSRVPGVLEVRESDDQPSGGQ